MITNLDLRHILRTTDNKGFLWALANTFPSLKAKLADIDPDRFAPMDLRTLVFGSSHGQRCALQFLLRVWNTSTDWDHPEIIEAWREHLGEDPAVPFAVDDSGEWYTATSSPLKRIRKRLGPPRSAHQIGSFDIFEALGVWDGEHRAAFLEWAKDPIWP